MSASLPFPPNYDQAVNQRKISTAGRIPQVAFKVSAANRRPVILLKGNRGRLRLKCFTLLQSSA